MSEQATLDSTIEGALADLERSIMEAKLHDDPLRLPLSALAAFLKAQQRLYADADLTLSKHIETARQPVRDDELRRAVVQGVGEYAGAMVRALNLRSVLLGAGTLLVALLIGAGAGYWLGHRVGMTSVAPFATMAPDDAGAWGLLIAANAGNGAESLKTCETAMVKAQDGRRACSLPVWLDPPSGAPATR